MQNCTTCARYWPRRQHDVQLLRASISFPPSSTASTLTRMACLPASNRPCPPGGREARRRRRARSPPAGVVSSGGLVGREDDEFGKVAGQAGTGAPGGSCTLVRTSAGPGAAGRDARCPALYPPAAYRPEGTRDGTLIRSMMNLLRVWISANRGCPSALGRDFATEPCSDSRLDGHQAPKSLGRSEL